MIKLKILLEKKKKKKDEIPLTSEDYGEIEKKFGPEQNRECSFHRDSDGYYCKTHRTRSKSYKEIKSIPMKDYKFVSSTS